MARTSKTAAKTAVKPAKAKAATPVATPAAAPRRFTPASFRSRRKRRKAERVVARTKMPHSHTILARSIKMIANHWEIFGGITLIYILLNVLLIGGISSGPDLQAIRDDIGEAVSGEFGQLGTGFTLFAFLVQSGNSVASGVASAYQSVILLLFSLAFVWALRQLYAGNKIRIRDAMYNSSYPLVQLLLVLAMASLHLIPAIISLFMLNSLLVGGILTVAWQQLIVAAIILALLTWSAYLLCHSVMAAYIVTLPDMTPLKALRSAKDIVRYRRATVIRKILFLPLVMLVVMAAILIPMTVYATAAAGVAYFLLTMIGLPVVHSYMYSLYRELIQ